MGPRLGIWLLALALPISPTSARAQEEPPTEAPNRQDEFWSRVKNMQAGPVTAVVPGASSRTS
jgi:hypothetical protein